MNILRMMAKGVAIMADPYVNPRDYNRSTLNGWQIDNNNLRGDVKAVGTYMGKAIANGKSNAGARNK